VKLPFVPRRYLNTALAEVTKLRQRVLDTEDRHDDAEGERRVLAARNAVLHAANLRLEGRNTELARRLDDSTDAAHMAGLERRIQHLEQQLDDACVLNDPAVEAGRHWQGRRQDKPIVKEPTS
jgi:hypothetical protein